MSVYSTFMNYFFPARELSVSKVRGVRVRIQVPGERASATRWVPATDKNVFNYRFLSMEWNRMYGAGTHTLEYGDDFDLLLLEEHRDGKSRAS